MGSKPTTETVGKSFFEAVKEPLRLVALGIVSWLSTEGLSFILDWLFGTKLDPVVKAQIITIGTLLLKGVDTFLHQLGKATDTKYVLGHNGLVPW